MSIPIAYCALVRAVDDAEALERLKRTMAYNLKHGAFTTVPCRCDPPCRELTEAEYDMLGDALFGGDADSDNGNAGHTASSNPRNPRTNKT